MRRKRWIAFSLHWWGRTCIDKRVKESMFLFLGVLQTAWSPSVWNKFSRSWTEEVTLDGFSNPLLLYDSVIDYFSLWYQTLLVVLACPYELEYSFWWVLCFESKSLFEFAVSDCCEMKRECVLVIVSLQEIAIFPTLQPKMQIAGVWMPHLWKKWNKIK